VGRRATAQTATGSAERAARLRALRQRLAKALPRPRCELDHQSPPVLFRRWPTPAALGAADRAEVETVVKSTGFFRNKARSIQETSRVIAAEHGGEVPRDIESLCELPGVARKTANVVLGTAYGVTSGIVVDTHVTRVAQRLGLSAEREPLKIEADLCAQFAKRTWVDTGHRLLLHGRYVCLARAPRCRDCPLNELCDARTAPPTGPWTARARAEQALVEG
jgi:endonuclease-3